MYTTLNEHFKVLHMWHDMAGLSELIITVLTELEGGAADEVQETLGKKAEASYQWYRINFNVAFLEQLKLVATHTYNMHNIMVHADDER